MLNRRALQGSADTASEAGAKMLSANSRAAAGAQPIPYTDSDIAKVVCDVAHKATSGGSAAVTCPAGVTAYYTDSLGTRLVPLATVGGGALPVAARGVEVTPRDDAHGTYFVRLVGQGSAQEAATATARFDYIQAVKDTTGGGLAHYAAWQSLCTASPQRKLAIGDQVIFRSNSWRSTTCGDVGSGGSNNFKGWFHSELDCGNGPTPTAAPITPDPCGSATPVTVFRQTQIVSAKGGNAIGLEAADIQAIHNAWVNKTPLFIPVVDYMDGNGSGIQFHISGFVGLMMDADWSSPSQGDWTGHIAAFSNVAEGVPCGSSCLPVNTYDPTALGLVH